MSIFAKKNASFTRRPPWRRAMGRWYYRWKRYWRWWTGPEHWATILDATPLPETWITHQTPLLRRLNGVDMALQYNKITNLRLAAQCLNGLLLLPGETFSFWKLVGKPTARKGYLDGLVLQEGRVGRGVGGGLCQMGNLLYWMALHSPLTVVERWRHSFDVFPDENRTLPFGSGATLAYNYIDLQLRNDTTGALQLCVWLSETHLHGAIRAVDPPDERYSIQEEDHLIRHEPWGGYSRHNRLVRTTWDLDGNLRQKETIAQNHALMMYQPFIA